MQENKDKLKEIAASHLAKFEAAPPEEMWSRIELQLRRRRRLYLVRVAALAASVLILLGLGLSRLMTDSVKESVKRNLSSNNFNASAKDSASTHTAGIPSVSEQSSNLQRKERIRSTTPSGQREKTWKRIAALQTEKSAETEYGIKRISPVKDEIAIVQDKQFPENEKVKEDSLLVKQDVAEVVPVPVVVNEVQTPVSILADSEAQPREDGSKNKNWGLAFGYGSNPVIELSQKESAMNSPKSNFTYDENSAEVANETSYFENVENTTHNAPVSLGILISKPAGKRWNLETGLIYTKLGYLIRTAEKYESYHEYRNEIYYLGIPLGIRFGLLERRHFGIFSTQSFIIEKGIAGRAYADTYSKGLLKVSESTNVSIRGIQLSSLTGIGAEVNIAPKFAVYGQGGVQLFFLNGTQPYNIRSARMAWPSFQVGLRIKMD